MNVGLVINLSGNDNVIGHKLTHRRSYTQGDSRKKVCIKKVPLLSRSWKMSKPLKSIEACLFSAYWFLLVQASKSMKFSKGGFLSESAKGPSI